MLHTACVEREGMLYQRARNLTQRDSRIGESLNRWRQTEVCHGFSNPTAQRSPWAGPEAVGQNDEGCGAGSRLLALAEIYDGGSRSDAARIGGVTLQIVRDWVLRFNARGPEGLVNGKAPGNRPKLNDEQRQALAKIVERGPIPAIHGVVRWRRKDLVRWIFEEFRITIDETTVGRELKALGFAKLSARPRHYAQNEFEVDAFKNVWLAPSASDFLTASQSAPTYPVSGR